jgi:very-short-patch-repair endonuclease
MVRAPKSLEKSCDRYKDIWSKRNELRADQVSISNGTKFWFDCHKCGHEYSQSPNTKTNGSGCPFCSNYKLCGIISCEFCLEKSCNIYSDTWSQKNDKTPEQVFLHCKTKFLFGCHNCGHEYHQRPLHKTNGSECPFCSGHKLCGKCDFCLDKSCNIYSSIWSQKNELEPGKVSISNGAKFWFDCSKCNHSYEQRPADKKRGGGCPYCAKFNSKLCGDKSCLFCLPKSCNVYSDIWSSKNDKTPDQVSISNDKKYWFYCPDCSHSYEQKPSHKTSGSGCSFCTKFNTKLCGDMNCSFCLSKSCNIYSKIWSKKNNTQDHQVSISSSKRFFFDCLKCSHFYKQTPSDKTKGQGCPNCKNKTERKVADFLKENDVKFKKEFKIDSNKRYDFCLPDFNLIIEIDGEQHFRQVRNWKSCEYTIENDIKKMKTAIENDYSILRIYQPDIWEEKIDWKKIINDNLYLRKTPTVCYQSSIVGIYEKHLIYRSVV